MRAKTIAIVAVAAGLLSSTGAAIGIRKQQARHAVCKKAVPDLTDLSDVSAQEAFARPDMTAAFRREQAAFARDSGRHLAAASRRSPGVSYLCITSGGQCACLPTNPSEGDSND